MHEIKPTMVQRARWGFPAPGDWNHQCGYTCLAGGSTLGYVSGFMRATMETGRFI